MNCFEAWRETYKIENICDTSVCTYIGNGLSRRDKLLVYECFPIQALSCNHNIVKYHSCRPTRYKKYFSVK